MVLLSQTHLFSEKSPGGLDVLPCFSNIVGGNINKLILKTVFAPFVSAHFCFPLTFEESNYRNELTKQLETNS